MGENGRGEEGKSGGDIEKNEREREGRRESREGEGRGGEGVQGWERRIFEPYHFYNRAGVHVSRYSHGFQNKNDVYMVPDHVNNL
jgi:hypothetical protein